MDRRTPVLCFLLATQMLAASPIHAQDAKKALGPRQEYSRTGTAQKPQRFAIILQSSSDPQERLKSSIPADFQNAEVFTSRRISESLTFYDISLGYFSSLIDAERAQKLLLKRFPDASVVPVRSATLPAQ
jgi:hypothetical protein